MARENYTPKGERAGYKIICRTYSNFNKEHERDENHSLRCHQPLSKGCHSSVSVAKFLFLAHPHSRTWAWALKVPLKGTLTCACV